MIKNLIPVKSLIFLKPEAPANKIPILVWDLNILWKLNIAWLLLHNFIEILVGALIDAPPGYTACNHFIAHDSKWPYITFIAVLALSPTIVDNLWSHVNWSPNTTVHGTDRTAVTTQSEIRNLWGMSFHQNVRWLYVSE